jgi:hypothetical protein
VVGLLQRTDRTRGLPHEEGTGQHHDDGDGHQDHPPSVGEQVPHAAHAPGPAALS